MVKSGNDSRVGDGDGDGVVEVMRERNETSTTKKASTKEANKQNTSLNIMNECISQPVTQTHKGAQSC